MVREHGNGIQTDYLVVKKLGWKRIAKNKQRFGWMLRDAVKETTTTKSTTYEGRVSGDTIYITPNTTSKSKIRINLTFLRDKNQFANLTSIKPLEIIYNIIFFIRRILGIFLLPVFIGIMIFGAFLGGIEVLEKSPFIWSGWCIAFFVWIVGIIMEGILARISAKILRYKE